MTDTAAATGRSRWKIRTALAVTLGLAALATGCGANANRDVKGVNGKPAYIEVFWNIDKHPNVALLCIHGAGFATTTRNYGDALMRVDVWDAYCADK